jgi:hypothetical protein
MEIGYATASFDEDRTATSGGSMGPAICQGCREFVWWDGRQWTDEDCHRHRCEPSESRSAA